MDISGYRIHAWDGRLSWESVRVPPPAPGQVQVAVDACGIGRTVVHYTAGSLTTDPRHLPRVPGHELAGTVTAAGRDVDPDMVGRRVMAYFYLICGTCEQCARGAEPHCRRLAGRVGVHVDGGYAPVVNLPAINAIEVPEGIDPVAATTIPDAIATPVHISRRAAISERDHVIVIGAGGGVGVHMIQVAAAAGADVTGLDIGKKKSEQISRFARAVDVADGLPDVERIGRPSVIVDFAGRPETLAWGFEALAPGGRMAILASFDDVGMHLAPRRLVLWELSVMGSLYASRSEVREAARMVDSGVIEPVVTEVVAAPGVAAIHSMVGSGDLVGRAALDWRLDRA
jgi:propanol-preferring alcohol dehydrogenase